MRSRGPMEEKKRRRKFRSYFINKNVQLKIAVTNMMYMILVFAIIILAVLVPYYFDIFEESELCHQYLSAKLFIVLLERLVIAVVGLSVVAFIHQIVITHKFCGPLVNLGYSQVWATGGNAGAAKESSEINLTRDDRADIAEFSILAPIFKDILKRLAELGIMQAIGVPEEEISILLSKDYEMVSWLTWEFNDKAALQQEQLEKEMMARGTSDDRNQYDKSNELRQNEFDDLRKWVQANIASDYDAATEVAFRILQSQRSKGKKTKPETAEWEKEWGWLGKHFDELRLERKMITREDVKRAFYKRAKETHPDAGGTSKEFINVHKHYQRLISELDWKKRNENVVHYNEAVQDLLLYSIRINRSMPMTPVASKWIKAVGFDEGSLYMQVHDRTKQGIDTYEYNPSDPEALYEDWVDSGSKGVFWWEYIRDIYSPAFKHGKPPAYLETGYGEDQFGTPEETRAYKAEGGGVIEGAGDTGEPYTLKTPYEWEHVGDVNYTGFPTITGKAKTSTNPKGAGRKSKPGRKKTTTTPSSPYPIAYNPTYNEKFREVLNSASALRRFAKGISTDHLPTGWSMKQDTPYKISELVNEIAKKAFRYNRVSFGNSVKAGHPYNYGGEDEFICPRDYKKNVGKKVPLGIYHNREKPGSVELPDWQIIGTHEVLGWDDTLGQEIAKNEYDEKKINEFFEKLGEENWIQAYFDAGEEPPISGAYSCNVVKYNDKNYQVNIELKSMSFVPDANCPWDICNFKYTPQEEVTA